MPGGGISKQGALAYGRSVEAVLAIGIGAGLGWWADTKFGTSPWLLLLGLVVGFGSFVLLIMRLARRLAETAEDDADTKAEP